MTRDSDNYVKPTIHTPQGRKKLLEMYPASSRKNHKKEAIAKKMKFNTKHDRNIDAIDKKFGIGIHNPHNPKNFLSSSELKKAREKL